MGAQHCPLGLHAPWGLRAAGVVAVPAPAPQRGALASRRCVLRGRQKGVPGCLLPLWGAFEFRRFPLPGWPPLGGLPRPATRVLWARVCDCGGPALSPWLACPVWGCVPRGWWGAVPRGGGLPPLRGASGARRCPSPCRPSSGTGGRGSATRVSWVWLVWAWGPSTSPKPCEPLMRALGAAEGRPRGGAVRRCEGHLRSGAPPPPAARPPGGLSGSATHVLWARVCGCGGPALSPWLARPVGGCVPWGWWGAVPGGLACHRCEGRLVSGAVPPPAARPLGGAAEVPRPVCRGCGWRGRGDPAPALQLAPLQPALRAVGVAEGRPRWGLPCAVVRGV